MKLKPAVFLDRDGVLNETFLHNGKPFAPRKLEEFKMFPNVPSVIQKLKKAGYWVIVVTNQPDVGNGLVDKEIVEAMHTQLLKAAIPDSIKSCYHSQVDNCLCRKPKPGMLLEAALEFGIDLKKSFLIGDRYSDIVAGNAAGCRTLLIECSYQEPVLCQPDLIVFSLEEAITAILEGVWKC